MNVNESQIITEIIQGRQNGYNTILKLYGQPIFVLIARLVDSPLDAEELTQDTFVKAFRHIESFNATKATFYTWISRIAYNNAVNYLKRKRPSFVPFSEIIHNSPSNEDFLTGNAKDTQPISDEELDKELSTGNEERIQILEESIEALPADEKTLLILYYYENRTMRDIAYIMNTKPTILSSRLYRIRHRLYKQIQKQLDIKRTDNGNDQ